MEEEFLTRLINTDDDFEDDTWNDDAADDDADDDDEKDDDMVDDDADAVPSETEEEE